MPAEANRQKGRIPDMRTTRWLAALTLAAVATAASAQGPGMGPGPGMGGPGQMGRMPFVMGTVASIDRAASTIMVNSPFGGGGETAVRVNAQTQVAGQVTIQVSDLKVDDQVQIQGMPTGLTANSINAGQMPDFLRMNMGRGPGGQPGQGGPGPGGPGQGGQPGQAAQGQGNRGQQPQQPAMAFGSVTGKVSATSPLTIAVSKDVSVIIKLAPDAKITKITTVTLASVKVGDRIMAMGGEADDGVFLATGIGVNMSMGGMGGMGGGRGGMGGFGMGGPGMMGGGGPGGPGGPGGGGNRPPQ